MSDFIVLLSPQHNFSQLNEVMKREGYNDYQELLPAAGCRRFLLIKNNSKKKLTKDLDDDILNS